MITKLFGVLNRVLDEEIRVQVGPLEYQVLVPEFVRRQVQMRSGQEIVLHITEYLEGNQSSTRFVPRRIGFLTEGELEFFELICTVDKIGVKKALKLMGRPIKEIAEAIQRQDSKWLTTLPGVGKQSAEQMIATLRTKVTRFALMNPVRESVEGESTPVVAVDAVIFEDAYAALLAMGLSPMDARTLLDQVIAGGKKCQSVQDVINAAFKKGGDS